MKAIHVTHFADDGNLAFAEDTPMPQLDPASAHVLVRVLACGLNAGDWHVMRGSVSFVMKPKAFPYVPGMDVCGIVEAVGRKCSAFAKGDRVAVVLGPLETYGGLAEFLVCASKRVALAPASLSSILVASLPIAGTTAVQAVKDARIRAGSRILVLGGSGGVGSLTVQVAKAFGASFVVTTTSNEALLKSLGVDQVIDYRVSKWWEVLGGNDLDAIIDCVGKDESWANCDRVLNRNGRFVAVSNSPDPSLRSVGELLSFAGGLLWRSLNPFTTSYKMVTCFPLGADVQAVMELANEGKIRAVLDPSTPCAWNLNGATQAVGLLRSHRAKGKLVFEISQ